MIAGRSCPLHYRYKPCDVGAADALEADALYLVGGLYGNPEALTAVEELAAGEGASIVFNGDCHWFDCERGTFNDIQDRVLAHRLTAGNVEAELADPSSAGCGCAYPDYVSDQAVERSNEIMEALKATCPEARMRELTGLPRYMAATVGGVRVGILHGDPESLAGWGLAAEAMPPVDEELHRSLGCSDEVVTERQRLLDWFREARVDVFASTHTCLPVLTDVDDAGSQRAIVNNGSAGMPNFRNTTYGLATRLAVKPHSAAVARLDLQRIVVELVPLAHDSAAWWRRFSHWWPEGSAARVAYARRLAGDIAYRPDQAVRGSARWLG